MQSRPQIAVVDDDEDIRRSLRRLLRSSGLDVKTYACAEDFKESMHTQSCDCLILDVRLPGISGIELHQQLMSDKQNIPTVFMSAHEDELLRAQRMTSHAVDYLRKPFDPEELLSAVQRAVAGRPDEQSQNVTWS